MRMLQTSDCQTPFLMLVLINPRHRICVRSTSNSCCIRYTRCNDDLAFSLWGVIADPTMYMAAIDSECTEDYIEAQSKNG